MKGVNRLCERIEEESAESSWGEKRTAVCQEKQEVVRGKEDQSMIAV
jgi:hypothetical protein